MAQDFRLRPRSLAISPPPSMIEVDEVFNPSLLCFVGIGADNISMQLLVTTLRKFSKTLNIIMAVAYCLTLVFWTPPRSPLVSLNGNGRMADVIMDIRRAHIQYPMTRYAAFICRRGLQYDLFRDITLGRPVWIYSFNAQR